MSVVFPDVINSFTGEPEPQVINSFNLPKIRLTIKANRMTAPILVQLERKNTTASSDIIKNFHTHSCLKT